MKRIILTIGIVLLISTNAMAQWGGSGGIRAGDIITHRQASEWGVVQERDTWFEANNYGVTTTSLQLRGFDTVRADFDVTGTDVNINVEWMCSNDSLWISGDSLNVTSDVWEIHDLMGCAAYNYHVSYISPDDSMTIYLTPYTDRINSD